MPDDDVHRGRRPGVGWTPLAHGLHVRASAVDDLDLRLRAWQLVLPPDAVFTGLTGALVRGWWVPPLPGDLPLFVAAGPTGRISRPGLAVCRHDVVPPWEVVDGVRVATAAETLLACSRDLGLLDVIVLGDAALHAGETTPRALAATAARRRRGAPKLRRAWPLMDGRAESIFEGLLRMLHEVCGVHVEPQHVVLDSDGSVVAHGDLGIVGTRELREYDGGEHLERPRQRRDLKRARLISDAGYVRKGYVKEDVLHQGLGVLRDADRAVGREHLPERIHAWNDLLRRSLFTPAGTRRLRLRLGLGGENADRSRT